MQRQFNESIDKYIEKKRPKTYTVRVHGMMEICLQNEMQHHILEFKGCSTQIKQALCVSLLFFRLHPKVESSTDATDNLVNH